MIKKLQDLGFSKKESEIYSKLVRIGRTTANELSKQTSTHRTVTYNVLQQLINRGLVTYIKKNKKRVYSISKPDVLIANVKEKEILAKSLVEEISNLKPKDILSKNVEVYEGLEGMKNVFEEIRFTKDLRVINATGLIFEYLRYSAGHIIKDIEKQKDVKVIANLSMKNTKLAKYKKLKIKYLPKEAENYATTFIFNEKIIIQVLKDIPFLIKIENKEIYEGYKKNFDVIWKKL